MSKKTIEDEMEALARSIIRDANRRTKGTDGKYTGVSLLDKARALTAAMNFLKERDKRRAETAPPEESDFERERSLYDGEREDSASPPQRPTNGTGHHTD